MLFGSLPLLGGGGGTHGEETIITEDVEARVPSLERQQAADRRRFSDTGGVGAEPRRKGQIETPEEVTGGAVVELRSRGLRRLWRSTSGALARCLSGTGNAAGDVDDVPDAVAQLER